jgi:hypothetical protein
MDIKMKQKSSHSQSAGVCACWLYQKTEVLHQRSDTARCMPQCLWPHYMTGPNLSLIFDFRQVSVDLLHESN